MNIRIEFIPAKEQRYPTIGDWYFDAAGDLVVTGPTLTNVNDLRAVLVT